MTPAVENIEAIHFHRVICQWWRIIRHQVCQAQAPAQKGGDADDFKGRNWHGIDRLLSAPAITVKAGSEWLPQKRWGHPAFGRAS